VAGPKKYSDELRERATRMALDARREPTTATRAIKRVADQLGIHPEALRTWVRQAEIDGGLRRSASMLRRARLRTVPGESANSAAVFADAEADIRPCPLRQTIRTPNRSVCSTSEESRRRSPDPIKPTCSPQDNTSLSSSLGETCSCSCCSGNLSVGTVRRSAHDGGFSAPSRATADRTFASTLPATFWCRHKGNCRISSQSWLATSRSIGARTKPM
jgi:transposase